MSVAQGQKREGVVLDRGDVTILDTRQMEWENHWAVPGAKMKVLSRDKEGNPLVWLAWMPPGTTSFNPKGPERHYHTKTREFVFVLFGELTMREYENVDDREGQPVLQKDGFYIDRRPGSWHGIDHTASSPIGYVSLQWRDGPVVYQTVADEDANVVEFL